MASIIANTTYTWTLMVDHQITYYMYLILLHSSKNNTLY